MDEVLRDHALLHAFAADDFHVLVGVFDLDIHQFVEKVGEVRPMRAAEQQAEFVEMVIDVVEHFHLMVCGIAAHLVALRLLVKGMEALLYLQEHAPHLLHCRLHDRLEQPFLILKARIDGASAGIRFARDGAQRRILIALFQKLPLRTGQDCFIDAFDLFCQGTVLHS